MSARVLDRSQPPPPGPLRPFHFPGIENLSLGNGIPVFFAPTAGLEVVTFSVLLPAGAIREDPAQGGLATLTGRLLESGTTRLDAEEVAVELESLGIRFNVGTSWEVTSVDFTALADRVAPATRLAAELMLQPTFPEHEMERLRHEQVARILQRRAEPRGFATEMANRYFFAPSSPFSRPMTGTITSVSGLERQHVTAYHQAAFTPAGAAIVVAGNIGRDAVLRAAEEAFGSWKGDAPPETSGVAEARAHHVQVVVVDRPGSVQSEIRVGHLGVQRNTPDFFDIVVMNTILGGAFSSRLNLNLREKHGFTYGASSSFVMRRQPGPFVVSTAVETAVTGAAVREILGELDRIRQDSVTDAELSDARNYVAGTFPLRLETTDGVASRLAELFIFDLPQRYLDEFPERILSVTAEQVLAAAQRYIDPERLTVLVVGDASTVAPQLDELAIAEVKIVTPPDEKE